MLVSPIEERLKQRIREVCQEHQAEIEELEVMPDPIQVWGSVAAQFALHRLIKLVKGRSARLLRQACAGLKRPLPTLRTNSYFVHTTGGAPLSVFNEYSEQQQHVYQGQNQAEERSEATKNVCLSHLSYPQANQHA